MLFEDRHQPTTLNELFSLLAGLTRVHFWRGSADARWNLDSTLVRRIINDESRGRRKVRPVTERSVAFWEKSLITRARHRRYDIVDGVRLGDFELLALLRHYGAATRLLDFTRSAAVGLWFATEDPNIEGELLGVNTEYVGGYSEGEPIDEGYDEVIGSLKPDSFLFSWEPTAVANRVSAQHSQFLFGQVEALSYGTLRLPLEKPDGVIVISVIPQVKVEVRTFLRNVLDIHSQTMFPDISGFAAAFGPSPAESPYRW